jgi:putative DNA primase/helicase
MVALAEAQPSLAVAASQLDADDWLLNVRNGTIDLRTGELRPHRRKDLITKLAPVVYDPDAPCPRFDAFLDRTFAADGPLTCYVLMLLGYCLTGDISAQYLPIFHGQGNNGKNVLLDTVKGLMGDYAADAPPSLLVQRQRDEHPTEIADLFGLRLAIASETEEGATLKLQLVKRLTGDATLKGRYMRADFFEFRRTAKIILVTNSRPQVRENTEAAWRRLRLVPFSVVIPEAERDPGLLDALKSEWSGILARLIRGCLAFQRDRRLVPPPAVASATADYRAAEDPVGEFLADCCVIDPPETAEASRAFTLWRDLLAAFLQWCMENGEKVEARPFGESLTRKGFPTITRRPPGGKPAKGRVGLRLATFGATRGSRP